MLSESFAVHWWQLLLNADAESICLTVEALTTSSQPTVALNSVTKAICIDVSVLWTKALFTADKTLGSYFMPFIFGEN